MKIVVTGALGHIGSRLIRELPSAFPQADVLLLDNLSTQRYCSLFNLPAEGKYRFIEADILQGDMAELFRGADVLIHLAAITNAAGSFEIAKQVEQVNLEGTKIVARACVQAAVPLIFLSTTSVYGTQSELVDEDCPESDLQPQSPYAQSKLEAENFLTQLGESDNLDFVILRLGTIFGASIGMRFHTAVNKFCWQASLGEPVTVWRTALHQKRPYLELGDAVQALKFVIARKLYDRRIYNILTLNSTVNDILNVIASHYPDLSIDYVDTKIMNQLSYEVANERFKKLGFEFHGCLENGVAETVDLIRGLGSSRTSRPDEHTGPQVSPPDVSAQPRVS